MAEFIRRIKIRHRLLTRLLVSHILIAAVPLFLTARVLIGTSQNAIEEIVQERNLEFAGRSTRFIDLKVNTAEAILRSQAKIMSVYEFDINILESALNTLVSEHAVFNQLAILDTLGELVVSTSFENEWSDLFEDQDELNTLLTTVTSGLSYRSRVYTSSELIPQLNIAEAIYSYGEVVAVLCSVVDLKTLWDIVDENVVGELGEAFVFDSTGVYIAHSDRKKVLSRYVFPDIEIVISARADTVGQMIYANPEGTEMIAAFAPIGITGWTAVIQQPTSEAYAPADRMRFRVIQFMIASILLAAWLAYVYTRWIVKPVDHLVSGIQQFSQGDLSHRIEEVTDDEIGTLAGNFNEMAERLMEYQETVKRTERFETLGKLASVLSHEIRNPLNSMVINMQILKRELSKPAVNRQRVEHFYEILSSEIKRVDQLVSDFLQVAKPAKVEKELVALDEVLDEVLMMNVADSLKKGIRVEREYQTSPLQANVDPDKIRQAFLNLVINAMQAMRGGGKLHIQMREIDGAGESNMKVKSVCVSFSDTGHGITEDDMNKIFDFYYSTKHDGSGLGLAIVQQIIDEHGGRITVTSEVGSGTTFTVYLPLE
jgi:signal transduction histidine kinase